MAPCLGKAPFLGRISSDLRTRRRVSSSRRCQTTRDAARSWMSPSAEAADFVYPDADIPTLILSGAMDSTTPPRYAAQSPRNLKTAYA